MVMFVAVEHIFVIMMKCYFSKTLSQERCFEVRDLIRKTNVEGVLEGKKYCHFD